jgi:hypothetical protein
MRSVTIQQAINKQIEYIDSLRESVAELVLKDSEESDTSALELTMRISKAYHILSALRDYR